MTLITSEMVTGTLTHLAATATTTEDRLYYETLLRSYTGVLAEIGTGALALETTLRAGGRITPEMKQQIARRAATNHQIIIDIEDAVRQIMAAVWV